LHGVLNITVLTVVYISSIVSCAVRASNISLRLRRARSIILIKLNG